MYKIINIIAKEYGLSKEEKSLLEKLYKISREISVLDFQFELLGDKSTDKAHSLTEKASDAREKRIELLDQMTRNTLEALREFNRFLEKHLKNL